MAEAMGLLYTPNVNSHITVETLLATSPLAGFFAGRWSRALYPRPET